MIAANNLEVLKKNKICSVLSVGDHLDFKHKDKYRYKQILIDDKWTADLLQHFLECFEFIDHDFDQGRNVLVHCAAGVSRSATVVIGYLMYKGGLYFNEAFTMVQNCRGCVNPNDGFIFQLKEFQQILQDNMFPLQKTYSQDNYKIQHTDEVEKIE
ncbi:dual specificity protein phosphatase 19 isoform x1 [Stylonychia lemnae]|uniref:protein-tyrosine-phosphatase n=1 Tax=Stylonychia lemnae TaxID=5949 RepID=A0A078AWH2_STYLE|nr:dual specificity protein phosphatase 19 isoform x1 [Stylonychia lemnae]|eukprot:CDW86391.1 dual specificity protein phosphatase 19 isoform x1 [Stylonychia lemnae]